MFACNCALKFLFGIGIGSVADIYTTECFRQNARSLAMMLCVLVNLFLGLLNTLLVDFVREANLTSIIFKSLNYSSIYMIVYIVLLVAINMLLQFKMKETKKKTFEQICSRFDKKNFKKETPDFLIQQHHQNI